MTGQRVRVLTVDDHPLLREGVRRICERTLDLEVVAEAGDRDAALAAVGSDIDVVVLDVSLGTVDGIEMIPALLESAPGTRVLLYTMLSEQVHAVRGFSAGAQGFVSKGCAPRELLDAIRTVAAGRRYVPSTVADVLARQVGRTPRLSERELEVLRLLAAGYRVGEVASMLHLSVKTVSTHKTNVQRKLGVGSLAGLVRYAVDNGIVAA